MRARSTTIPGGGGDYLGDRFGLRFRDGVDERAAAVVETGDALARVAGELEQELRARGIETADAAGIDRAGCAAALDLDHAAIQRRRGRQRPVAGGYDAAAGIDIEGARLCHGPRLQGGGPARNVRAVEPAPAGYANSMQATPESVQVTPTIRRASSPSRRNSAARSTMNTDAVSLSTAATEASVYL